jgi:hypothetical protein
MIIEIGSTLSPKGEATAAFVRRQDGTIDGR